LEEEEKKTVDHLERKAANSKKTSQKFQHQLLGGKSDKYEKSSNKNFS